MAEGVTDMKDLTIKFIKARQYNFVTQEKGE